MINRLLQEAIMKPSTRLYACIKLLAILHVVERLISGMQDLRQLQYLIAMYERRFRDTSGSIAALVTISASLAAIAVHCILKGGLGAVCHDVCSWIAHARRVPPSCRDYDGRPLYGRYCDRCSVHCLRRAVPESPGEIDPS